MSAVSLHLSHGLHYLVIIRAATAILIFEDFLLHGKDSLPLLHAAFNTNIPDLIFLLLFTIISQFIFLIFFKEFLTRGISYPCYSFL